MEYHNLDDKNNVNTLKEFLEKNGFKVIVRTRTIYPRIKMLYARKDKL
jgi:hypothetical protein